MGRAIASVSRATVAMLLTVSIPWVAQATPAEAAAVSVQVAAVTQTVTNLAASQTPATAGCPAGTVLVGGGIRVFHATGGPDHRLVDLRTHQRPRRQGEPAHRRLGDHRPE